MLLIASKIFHTFFFFFLNVLNIGKNSLLITFEIFGMKLSQYFHDTFYEL